MTTTTAPDRVRSTPTLHQSMRAIGEMDARRAQIRLKQAKDVEKRRARDADELAELDAAIADQMEKLSRYVDANRDAVLGGKKTVMTEAGEIAVRALPVQAVLSADEQTVIDELERLPEADAYLRRTVKVDMRAVVKDRPAVEGLTYVAGREQLVIIPITSGEKIAVEV